MFDQLARLSATAVAEPKLKAAGDAGTASQ